MVLNLSDISDSKSLIDVCFLLGLNVDAQNIVKRSNHHKLLVFTEHNEFWLTVQALLKLVMEEDFQGHEVVSDDVHSVRKKNFVDVLLPKLTLDA